MIIKRYTSKDSDDLIALIEREGDEWKDYWYGGGRMKYQKALASSIVYLLFENETLCAYMRCRDDDGYGIYIYDLLVDKNYRGKEYGRLLMEKACTDFPGSCVYVMGDVYPYYDKLGYDKEGAIYCVKAK